jgi:hypothetical protein
MNKPDSFDDIPDTIEIDGKIHPFDKEKYRKFAIEGGKRIMMMANGGVIELKLGGKPFATVDLTDIVKINPDKQGTTIQLGEPGPKFRNGLVGMGGIYYDPKNIGAENIEYVKDSWDWLFTRKNFPKEDFENMLEGESVMYWIMSGRNQTTIHHIMSMAVDLKILFDNNIDVSDKVSEIIKEIRGNWRKFNKIKNKKKVFALIHFEDMALAIADMLAETKIAAAAYNFGLDVKMKKTPDVLIDGIRLEAKFDRRFLMNDNGFDAKVTKGLNQGGDLVAIFTGSFGIKKLKNKKLTWLVTEGLETALLMALEYCKNGKKCVLLFTGTNKGEIGRVAIVRN